LAAAIFQRELAVRKTPGEWSILSAGVWVDDLMPPTPEAFTEAAKRELDISSHTTQGIETLDLDSIDLFLVMEQGQKESILIDFPNLRDRIFLLSELSGPAFSIPDPYVTKEPYDEIAKEIEALIKANIGKITALASRNNHK
jgi:protein-tyrosine-phosphatase